MFQIVSRDGKFTISASENSKTVTNSSADDYDEENDVYLECIEGKKASLYDVADAIFWDCFSMDALGLKLRAKKLHCHVKSGYKTYTFDVPNLCSVDEVLYTISRQCIL